MADSVPEAEYQECLNKAAAVVRALREAQDQEPGIHGSEMELDPASGIHGEGTERDPAFGIHGEGTERNPASGIHGQKTARR